MLSQTCICLSNFGVMLPCVAPLSSVQLKTGDDKTVSKEELGKGRQQVSDSRSRLLKLKTERDLDVSAVRVTGDERESQRRSKEEEERQVTISMQLDFPDLMMSGLWFISSSRDTYIVAICHHMLKT